MLNGEDIVRVPSQQAVVGGDSGFSAVLDLLVLEAGPASSVGCMVTWSGEGLLMVIIGGRRGEVSCEVELLPRGGAEDRACRSSSKGVKPALGGVKCEDAKKEVDSKIASSSEAG